MGTSSAELEATPRTTLKRAPDRGTYDREAIHAILDEALICHLGFSQGGKPGIIPTILGRSGDTVYVHGSTANRALRALAAGGDACLEVTLIDALVLGRSAFHQSMNYRSVILYGPMREVTDAQEKLEALRVLVEHAIPGRWKDVRGPNVQEFQRTLVLALDINEGTAKVRSGPPIDDEEDYELACWAGLIPLEQRSGAPVPDGRLLPGVEVPAYASDYRRPGEPRS
jgi:nitroimidazol reductase NimA-like FMN-containing flavoprotein (pyridoxamine 5'-phosphate oxidase superfamily)